MRVGVGYSENPDSVAAGRQVARQAVEQAGGDRPCDLALLFCTARHDAAALHGAVAETLGPDVPLVGGGAVGVIGNDHFGYAGDQIGLAAFWFEGAGCDILAEGGLKGGEEAVGERLGRRLAARGAGAASPVLLLYDAIDRTGGDVRLLMASPLLDGMAQGMGGRLPNLVGAGLQGDYACTPVRQFDGRGIAEHKAVALAFPGGVRLDSAIMHGCHPATGYYTVTKAERQVILEIDGVPALEFLGRLIGPSIAPERYAFFLIFGINSGDPWADFHEERYASRLCLAIDRARGGVVMFEPDMQAGTRFQIMIRSFDLDYMVPRIEEVFARAAGRRPAFAFYIDCAGRAAGAAGFDREDATVVQRVVAGRVPLLGIYSGVEIAAVAGRPRALDWTGVFCLFSVPT